MDDKFLSNLQADLSHDTVGAEALDKSGTVVAGISTGGKCGTRDGRLGSGPTLGKYLMNV